MEWANLFRVFFLSSLINYSCSNETGRNREEETVEQKGDRPELITNEEWREGVCM